MPSFRSRRRGLSLLDPVVGALLVGVGATALLPRLVELQQEAREVALQQLAGTASRAMAVNRALCQGGAAAATGGASCQPVRNCQDLQALLIGGLPAGYSVVPQPLTTAEAREGRSCSLMQAESGLQAPFQGLAAGS